MRIPRLYLNQPLVEDDETALDARCVHYLNNVLRMKAGMKLVLFNGSGLEYHGILKTLSKKDGLVAIEKAIDPGTESSLRTLLAIGISRGERMDYVIQKSTELGVSSIQPLTTEFCEVKLNEKRIGKKHAHWQQVSISACEQSGRVVPPEIFSPIALPDWLDSTLDYHARILLDQSNSHHLNQSVKPNSIVYLAGPEGGLSEKEKALAVSKGFSGFSLGPRTLRTETAPVAALSVFQYLWGYKDDQDAGVEVDIARN
jgi:16S rRNA (uracil1498-N3)-methyltransferase